MYDDVPDFLVKFFNYSSGIKNRSKNTVREYYYDLRDLFKFLKLYKIDKIKYEKITNDMIVNTNILNIDISFLKTLDTPDFHAYLSFLKDIRGDEPTTRARKVAAIKTLFKYLTSQLKLLDKNPALELETPKIPKRLPKYLTLDESINLLHSISGKFEKRDYCIITFFLNCGLRLSELIKINLRDIRENSTLNVIGKGDKERSIYLNEACISAYKEYLAERSTYTNIKDKEALFVSERGTRIGRRTVEVMVKKYIKIAGLDPNKYSPHKLRHTAATLMHKYGMVDIRALQQILGHESISTTEIYTHVDSDEVKYALKSNPLNNIKNK